MAATMPVAFGVGTYFNVSAVLIDVSILRLELEDSEILTRNSPLSQFSVRFYYRRPI